MLNYDRNPNEGSIGGGGIDPLVGGCGGSWGVENGTNRNVDTIFLSDFHRATHHMPILHSLVTIHNAADKQTTERSE